MHHEIAQDHCLVILGDRLAPAEVIDEPDERAEHQQHAHARELPLEACAAERRITTHDEVPVASRENAVPMAAVRTRDNPES